MLDEAKIKSLKLQHGNELFHIAVDPVEPGVAPLDYVFKMPDRKVLNAVAKVGQSQPFEASDIMLKSCMVYGDEAALEDIRVFSSVSAHFEEIMRPRQSSLKKL